MAKIPNANEDPMKTEGGKVEQSAEPPFTPTNQPVKQNPVTRKEPPPRSLSVRATRHYGAIDIEFGVAATFTVENEADQERLWSLLWNQVNGMHDRWAENELPHVSQIKPPKKTAEQPAASDDVYTLVTRNVVGGSYKFLSEEPRYARFGATATKELYDQADALIADHPESPVRFAVKNGRVVKVWTNE